MFLQGNLQKVFDALYELGLIEPVLELDWSTAMEEMQSDPEPLIKVVEVVNQNQHDANKLITELKKFDDQTLSYLAMEVAREYADFHSRGEVH
jgi:hypothetical protein